LSEKYPKHEQLIDIASAFNFERKGLKTILEYAMSGTPVEVVVTSQDRLAKSGFQLIRWIIELYGGEIIILDKKIKTEKFDTTNLSVLLPASGILYGRGQQKEEEKGR